MPQKVEIETEKEVRATLESLVKQYDFEAVRRAWNHYGNALKDKMKIQIEKKALEDRLAAIEKKLK